MMEWTLPFEANLKNSGSFAPLFLNQSSVASAQGPLSEKDFIGQLESKITSYHIYHPFQVAMKNGMLTKKQMQGWVLNRFYYQYILPMKDSSILANCPEPKIRKEWIKRIIDHDGDENNIGGTEAWIKLGEACGIERSELTSLEHVIPAVRFACDSYVTFTRRSPWQESVCSTLTELFASNAHQERIETFPINYPWIGPEGFIYFNTRVVKVKEDVSHSLAVTLKYFNTYDLQQRAFRILEFKLDILWAMLDAIQLEYGIGEKHES